MSFTVTQKTLERLEWPVIVERLANGLRTPRGHARLLSAGPDAPLFESDSDGVRQRLAETRQALEVLESGDEPPLGGTSELGPVLARAAKGGVLVADELLDVGRTLAALQDSAVFLARRSEQAPALAAWIEEVASQAVLRAEIDGAIDDAGAVRDGASQALADARRDSHRLAGEIQRRVQKMLHHPDVKSHLSDTYFTVRNDRFVLPVRADARGAVRGIVHDASRSGTTVFIEPEALVELNNQRKRAELAIEQETRRVLRALSEAVADAAPAIDAGLDALAGIDLAFGRARLARDQAAVEPEVGDEGVIALPQARHPLLPPDEAVPNDLNLGQGFTVLVLSGPNAGGKTVAMKCAALAVLFVRAGLFVPAEAPARVDLFDAVLADIGDEQDIREHISTFSAHMANLAHIVDVASERALCVLDEIGVGTDPGEGAAIAQAVLEKLASAGARIVTTTHYNLLKEMAEVDERFANASVEFDPETLAPTYRLRMGLPGSSSAAAVAARMGLHSEVLERAEALISREDRRLDAMLRELAANRAALEHEQSQAARLRAETEAVRSEYGRKLERLQDKRDSLYRSMRDDLDRAFKEAHGRIAGVVRDLQRGGARAQDAARAREELLALERETRAAERAAGAEPPAPRLEPVDWNRARPGDPVTLADGGAATLVALPDRRGRVSVRLGSARVQIAAERVGAAAKTPAAAAPTRTRTATATLPEGGTARCDLRGLRVDEALDRLDAALDAALSEGRDRLEVVHGLGTGALRRAVREHLQASPYVERFAGAAPEEGGDGVTSAELR
jgi:DNA mismatch repair protein MutS2